MTTEYSVELCKTLERKFHSAGLHRPMKTTRYDPGTELVYDITSIENANKGRVHLVVEKFVGGGFAGQVYQVKITEIIAENGPLKGLEAGGIYAIKILIPPSTFSLLFRNILYWLGFQGPFQLQTNPAAARAGALWQKFIRRAAKIKFGNENAVVDIYATFVDKTLGSCGELSQWVDGRTWRLEVDDRLDLLKKWRRNKPTDTEQLGSPEYRAKKKFMADFVTLLHDMGGHEFARQYEWSTCKSQPNCLKRWDTDNDPSTGLVAVDFRAGLVLLPFLPMSPGDFGLIWKGLKRGSLVQFDRGNISKLQTFIQTHKNDFKDMKEAMEELKVVEDIYRNSIPDITHNHIRLLYSGKLWSTILNSAITGWKIRGLIEQHCERKLRANKILTLMFFLIGLIPLLGKVIRKTWGRTDWRKHYRKLFTSWKYFKRAVHAKITEKIILWHKAGRVNSTLALKISEPIELFLCHLMLSILPICLHKFLTDFAYTKERLAYIFIRPVKLYFNAQFREQWLRDMVVEGQKKHILTGEDANIILSQVNEPFIQKYLKSMAVHICTLPVTQIVSVLVAWFYVRLHPQLTTAEATAAVAAILVLFQITPISPGSLVRGFYVLYLVIRERSFKDYNIAVFLGFFKYIGYLAFPIQMTYHYPALARFMAGHWATEAVHIVPVFGEGGALLEHWVFYLFYNWPLTIRRRMRKRAEIRASIKARYWHVALYAIAATAIFGIADFLYLKNFAQLPSLKDIWWLSVLIPLLCGTVTTLGCGGAALWKRIVFAVVCGAAVGILYTAVSAILAFNGQTEPVQITTTLIWRVFIFAVLSPIGAILTELKLPEPNSK